MKRLLSHTDEVAPHPAVDDPLLGDDVEVPVHLENPDPRGDHDGLLARPVQVPVDEMLLEGVERNVENLQEVSLGGCGEPSLGCGDSWPGVVVNDELEISAGSGSVVCVVLSPHLVVLHKGLSQEGQSGEPIVKLLILDYNSVEILVISSCTKSENKAVRQRLSGLASSVVSLETFLHVSRELGQILGFVEHSAEQNYGDLVLQHFRDLSEFY